MSQTVKWILGKRIQIANLAFQILNHTVFILQQDKGFQDLTNDREFFIQSTTGIMCMKTPSLWTKSYVWCYHSNETSSAVLSHGTIYLVCSSNFWVCGWNPMVWPFKWNLFVSTFAWSCLFVCLFSFLRNSRKNELNFTLELN